MIGGFGVVGADVLRHRRENDAQRNDEQRRWLMEAQEVADEILVATDQLAYLTVTRRKADRPLVIEKLRGPRRRVSILTTRIRDESARSSLDAFQSKVSLLVGSESSPTVGRNANAPREAFDEFNMRLRELLTEQ